MPPQLRLIRSPRCRRLTVGGAAVAIAWSGSLGCNTLFGVDDLSYDTTSSTSGVGGSTSSGTTTSLGGNDDPCSTTTDGCRCFRDDGDCPGLPDLSGWDTRVQLYTGTQSAAPSCVSAIQEGSTDTSGVECPLCECPTSNASCPVSAQFFSNNPCANSGLDLEFDTQSCKAISNPTSWVALNLTFQPSGSCTPVGKPSVADGTFVALCPAPSSCSDGCLPVAGNGWDEKLCVARAGDVSCPDGFSESHKVYASDDFCNPCSCASAQGVSCRLNLHFNDAVCAGSYFMPSSDVACDDISNPPPQSGRAEITSPGSCQAAGGTTLPTPTTISQTVCCL